MNARRSHQILDATTRARYRNERESMELREKINDLSWKQHLAVYRNMIEQNNLKMKLYEFYYEGRQRQLYKLLVKRSGRSSATSSTNRSDTSEKSDRSSMVGSSLLLHDLNASIESKKCFTQLNIPNKPKKLNPYDDFCLQYGSKLQIHCDSLPKSVPMSFKQYSERMKTDIKIARTRSARYSHSITRHDERIY